MHPVICQIGPFTVYSYGVMLALAIVICTLLLQREARSIGIPSDVIVDFVFWVVVSGIVGCRLFFIFLNLSYFLDYPKEIFMLHHGGLAWQGGLLTGILASFLFIKKKALPLGETIDMVAPYLALGQAIGRVGCFLNGCCYGREATWGVFFPVHQATLHPTQLYAFLGLLGIFLILKKFQRLKRRPGQVLILYAVLASAQRFLIEFFRADHEIFFLGLSVFQWNCLGILLVAIYANILIKSRSGRS